jgi:hypothetical protein
MQFENTVGTQENNDVMKSLGDRMRDFEATTQYKLKREQPW